MCTILQRTITFAVTDINAFSRGDEGPADKENSVSSMYSPGSTDPDNKIVSLLHHEQGIPNDCVHWEADVESTAVRWSVVLPVMFIEIVIAFSLTPPTIRLHMVNSRNILSCTYVGIRPHR